MNKFILLTLISLTSISAYADVEAGEAKATVCVACHGPNGNSAVASFPKLAGQNIKYFIKQMQNFKSGSRKDAIMQGQVATLSEQDIKNLALYFAAQTTSDGFADKDLVAKGQKLYRGGNKLKQATACIACHGPKGAGNKTARYPKIAGQYAAYTIKQLNSFKNNTRTNDTNSMMQDIAKRLTAEDIKAVASYIQGLY